MKRHAASAFLVIVSMAGFVLATEIFFRIFPGRIPTSVEFLVRARIYDFDRGLGVVLRPDVDVRVPLPNLGRTVRVATVSHGQPVGFRDNGFQGGPRIAILGDSYVFGYGVDQDEAFPAQLERKLRASGRTVDIINAGVPGYGARLERIFLDRYVLPLRPAVVLVAVFENDFSDNVYYAHRRFGAVRTFLGLHSVVYDLLSAAWGMRGSATQTGRNDHRDRQVGEKNRPSQGYLIEQEEIARMSEKCRAHGARFGVILLPATPSLDPRRVVGNRADIPVLDLASRFAALPPLRYLNLYVGHLTPEANGWVADEVADFIKRRDLLTGVH